METAFHTYFRQSDQAIESYVTELQIMHNIIIDNDGHSTPEILRRNFIFNLGPEFSEVAKRYDLGTLPSEWNTTNLNDLIPVAKRFFQATLSTRARNKRYKDLNRPQQSPAVSSSRPPGSMPMGAQQVKNQSSSAASKELTRARMQW